MENSIQSYGRRLAFIASPNHPVRARQQVGWNRQTDLLGRLQIDDELELLRLLHCKIGRLGAFQNFVHICSGAPVQVVLARAVGHKPPGFDKI
jgi:hypothetical protein